jgi:hypothetical protein
MLERLQALPRPEPPSEPAPQPVEAKDQTVQMGSFRQAASPHNGHRSLDLCPNCRSLGYINANCHFVLPGPQS